jgi:AdoMet-dependent heme synthase
MTSQIRATRGAFDDAPFMVFWETTRACDLACFHCRACAVPNRDPRELDTREGMRLLDEIAAMGTKLVVLTGGDPAKRDDLVALVAHGTSLGLRMALTPSATPLVTHALITALARAGLVRLAISIDSADPVKHDGKRGMSGAFMRSIELLEHARMLGLGTQINASVAQYEPEEIDALAALAEALAVDLFSVFVIVPTGRAEDLAAMSPERVEALLDHLASIAERAPFDVKTTAAPHFRRVLLERHHARKDIVGIDDGIGRALRGVNDGQGIVFVSHVGAIHPSGFMPIDCGNVRLEGLTRTYRENVLFRALRNPDGFGGKCGRCEFRKVCGGSRARAYAVRGDPLGADPACLHEPARKSA